MILDLPCELVQLILRSCDPPTYLQMSLCCRSLHEMATQRRTLVLHQLHQTPGCTDEVDTMTTPELVQRLKKLSHQELFGTEHFTDRKLIDFQGKKLNTLASSLESPTQSNRALLVFQNDETVYVVDTQAGTVKLQRRLESPAKRFGTIEVLRTAFNSNGAYVLHRFQPFLDKHLDTTHPFVMQAMQSNSPGSTFLSYYSFESTDILKIFSFPDEAGYDPIALAVHHDAEFAISWQHRQSTQDHHVVLYILDDADDEYVEEVDEDENGDEEAEDADEDEDEQVEQSDEDIGEAEAAGGPPMKKPRIIWSSFDAYGLTEVHGERNSDRALEGKGPSTKLVFNDRGYQLLHHYGTNTLFSSFQKLNTIPRSPEPAVHSNKCVVDYSPALMLQFEIGIPFFATHRTGNESPIPGTCHWQYLAVGIATHRINHWTVACLLRSESNPQAFRCNHSMNLDRGRRFDDWTAVAQLGGYQEHNTSQASIIAASPLGTRLALASWNTVTVWALEPRVLIDEEAGHYPASWINSAGLTELRPVEVKLNAVCSHLKFTENENELVAITDRGLMLLDIRPSGRGIETIEHRKVLRN